MSNTDLPNFSNSSKMKISRNVKKIVYNISYLYNYLNRF